MKKIFMMIALVLCALGTAFADKYYNSESEFYRDLDKAARKYKWCYVVDVFEEGGDAEFASEFYDDEDEERNEWDRIDIDNRDWKGLVEEAND